MSETGANRLAGICGVLFLPLIAVGFGVVVGVSPTIEDDARTISDYYVDLDFERAMVGEWLEVLAFAALLVFAARFAHLVRGTASAWLGWLALAAGAALGAAVVGGVAPLIGSAYVGDHGGVAEEHYVVLNAVRSAIHWTSTVFAGLWLLATAAAARTTGLFPRWHVWAGIAVALLMLVGVAAPLLGGVDLGQMLMGVWVLIAGVLLVRAGHRVTA